MKKRRCNQCGVCHAEYYGGTDEYLCEECEDFARTLITIEATMAEMKADENES
jgi:hypothetical protein